MRFRDELESERHGARVRAARPGDRSRIGRDQFDHFGAVVRAAVSRSDCVYECQIMALVAQYVGEDTRANASPDDTLTTIEMRLPFTNSGSSAAVRRIGPSRLVAMIDSESARPSGCQASFSMRMMPALLIGDVEAGKRSAICPAKAAIAGLAVRYRAAAIAFRD